MGINSLSFLNKRISAASFDNISYSIWTWQDGFRCWVFDNGVYMEHIAVKEYVPRQVYYKVDN